MAGEGIEQAENGVLEIKLCVTFHIGARSIPRIILDFLEKCITGDRTVMPFSTMYGKTRRYDSMCYGGVKAGRPLCWS